MSTNIRTVRLKVNGREYESSVEVRKTLADFLRDELDLTGTHLGCEHGVCGACTILFNGDSVRSCLMLAVQADGADLTTVEGLAQGEDLHPLQLAFQENHALLSRWQSATLLAAVRLRPRNRRADSASHHAVSTALSRTRRTSRPLS